MSYFKNKTIWVTGASSGIGKELVLQLGKLGAILIISGRRKEKLQEIAEICVGNVEIIPFDISIASEVSEILEKFSNSLKEVDILINNAGVSQRSLVVDTDLHVYKKLMETNFYGSIQLSSAMLQHFIEKQQGHFVVMSSMAGKFAVPFRSGYSAAKMALHGYFDALRLENESNNIFVTIICPGFIQTAISKHAFQGNGQEYGKMDDGQANGMPVEIAVSKMITAITRKKREVYIGGFKETKMAIVMKRLFPSLFHNILRKTKVT